MDAESSLIRAEEEDNILTILILHTSERLINEKEVTIQQTN